MFCRLRRKFTTKANNFHLANLVGKHHLLIGRRGETVQGQRRKKKNESTSQSMRVAGGAGLEGKQQEQEIIF